MDKNKQLYGFIYRPDGPYSISCNIIIAHDEEEAMSKAMEYLTKLQNIVLETGPDWRKEDWLDLHEVFINLELLSSEDDIIFIGGYIE